MRSWEHQTVAIKIRIICMIRWTWRETSIYNQLGDFHPFLFSFLYFLLKYKKLYYKDGFILMYVPKSKNFRLF